MLKKLVLSLFFLTLLLNKASSFEKDPDYQVLTLSAAIMDHYLFVTEEELQSITHEKGGWAPIDHITLQAILNKNNGASKMITGGSGANVTKGLAQLGEKCILIGKVGDDEKGEYYAQKLRTYGITPLFEKGELPTGEAICFITPDGERTFRTYLGASHSLTDLPIEETLFDQNIRHLHIEGYQLIEKDLVVRMLKLAKKANVTTSIDLGNVELVRKNKAFIQDILTKYIDIVFCNEREAKELTDLPADQSCDQLAQICEIAVVTMGKQGSLAQRGKTRVYMSAFDVNVIDTTGAGDLYASGFLHGYLREYSLKKCMWIAAFISSHVVQCIGPEIPEPMWEGIRKAISNTVSKKNM